jgi:hypothetical protein
VTADPPAAPAAAAPAATAAPEATPPATDEAEGPGFVVAPADAPAAAPAAPAAPFVLEGFLDPTRLSSGVAARLGFSSSGLATGLDATLRLHGVVLGATVGIASELSSGNGSAGLRTMGLLAGYGLQRGRYRGEALLGWGVTDERVKTDAGTSSQTGHFTSVQAAVDRVMWGGAGWRASLGAMAWWRSISPNDAATLATLNDEFGLGVRIGAEGGW